MNTNYSKDIVRLLSRNGASVTVSKEKFSDVICVTVKDDFRDDKYSTEKDKNYHFALAKAALRYLSQV